MPGNFNINRIKSQLQQRGGLSRGLFYECAIDIPILPFQQDETIVLKNATIPSETLDSSEIKYFTRSIKIPASRQFSPLTLTFYNTVDYSLRAKFSTWMNLFNSPITNVRGAVEIDTSSGSLEVSTEANQRDLLQKLGKITITAYNNTGGFTWDQLKDLAIGAAVGVGESVADRINPIAGSIVNQIVNNFDTRQVESNNPSLVKFVFYDAFPSSISGLQFSYDDDTSYQTYDVEFQFRHMTIVNPKDIPNVDITSKSK